MNAIHRSGVSRSDGAHGAKREYGRRLALIGACASVKLRPVIFQGENRHDLPASITTGDRVSTPVSRALVPAGAVSVSADHPLPPLAVGARPSSVCGRHGRRGTS